MGNCLLYIVKSSLNTIDSIIEIYNRIIDALAFRASHVVGARRCNKEKDPGWAEVA
jgi:hypothetical protein